ncbi:MAG: hypothetical protein IRZ20_02160 [Thermoleophilia bacterium]|nr:hypothetical protein [Thermoleophilia bacterium]
MSRLSWAHHLRLLHWRPVETANRPASTRAVPTARRPRRGGGPDGNERLTGATAALLLLLLAAEGVTILLLRPLFSAHVFVGMLLIPPVALKLGSTGWRFVRYYQRDPAYRRKGPPPLPLRLLAPLVVASTVAVFATGVTLLAVGPAGGVVLGLHKASFVVWLGATGVHVLAHARRVPALAAADWHARAREGAVGGVLRRRLALVGATAAGVVLAVATLRYAHPWLHWLAAHGGDDGG